MNKQTQKKLLEEIEMIDRSNGSLITITKLTTSEDLFQSLGEILKPTDPSNPFGIDYSVYVECEVLSVYSRSVKVRELATDRIAYVDVNHILYSAMGIGDIVKADKNFMTFYL